MRQLYTILVLALLAMPLEAGEKLSAEAIPGVKLRGNGKIVIQGDGGSVRAYQIDGNLRKQLVRIKSTRRSLGVRPFGPEVYDSGAATPARVPAEIRAIIAEAAREHGVDPRLVTAVAYHESGFQQDVVSSAGACGVMQLMPATAKILGVTEIFDLRQNIFGGTRYLRMLLDTFSGDLDLTLAAYNAGPGAVERHRGVPPYRETTAYVKNVRAAYERSLRDPRA